MGSVRVLHLRSDNGFCQLCGATQGEAAIDNVEFNRRMSGGGYIPCYHANAKQREAAVATSQDPEYIRVNDPKLRALLQDCLKTLDTKGADYTAGNLATDRLHNFRTAASDIGIPMVQVWYTYFYKHLSSIKKYVRDGRVESEPIRGRVIDLINYLWLFLCIIDDSEGGKK